MEDDDDFDSDALYKDGTWKFDENLGELVFMSNRPPSAVAKKTKIKQLITSEIEFRADVDIFEQDLKDLAIFTAPMKILTPKLIQILHVPTTDRLIRAAILYFLYYIQISAVMESRVKELSKKIHTDESDRVENDYQNNLCDLRAIMAREYCLILLGGGGTKKFHHKGADKKQKSLHDTDARLFEIFIRFLVQIVWLGLGRMDFSIIQIEINRLFKTDIYNAAEHNLRTGYLKKMHPYTRKVCIGTCAASHNNRYFTKSPLFNEVLCPRDMDFRMMALGSMDMQEHRSPERILFFERALTEPEENLQRLHISLGLLGIPRALFDTMLIPLPDLEEPKPTSKMSTVGSINAKPRTSSVSKKSTAPDKKQIYPPLVLPPRTKQEIYYPPEYPQKEIGPSTSNKGQLKKWLNRLKRYYSC